jgi:hypothetical protein
MDGLEESFTRRRQERRDQRPLVRKSLTCRRTIWIREHLDAHSLDEAEAGRNAKSNGRTNGTRSSMAWAWSSCPMTTWRGASRERTLSLARRFRVALALPLRAQATLEMRTPKGRGSFVESVRYCSHCPTGGRSWRTASRHPFPTTCLRPRRPPRQCCQAKGCSMR